MDEKLENKLSEGVHFYHVDAVIVGTGESSAAKNKMTFLKR